MSDTSAEPTDSNAVPVDAAILTMTDEVLANEASGAALESLAAAEGAVPFDGLVDDAAEARVW